MINVHTIEDIYPAIDELIKVLPQKNKQCISNVLSHRMYKVSWTSRDELFEDLQNVLKDFLKKEKDDLDSLIVDQVNDILQLIEKNP